MTQYYGDYLEDETVYIPFNTFDSNDPSASVTITNLADADIKVHKDGSATQIVTDGATVAIDFDSITGNHLITIDTSVHADYATGSDYLVRIEGTTVDGATINAWVGSFSIENRSGSAALRPTTAGRTLDVTATGAAGIDWGNIENKTTANDLSGTDIQLCDTITTYTGNTVQTGDAFARLGAPAGASVSADIATVDSNVDAILVDTGTTLDTHLTDIKGATFNGSTDSLEAIRDRGDAAWTTGAGGSDRLLMVDTTIATLSTQTTFTLTSGSADDDAYNNCTIVVEDASTSTQKAVGMVLDYTGSTKEVTLKEALAFVIATTDKVYILAENSLKSTVANRQLDVTATGAAGIDWGNVENPTTAVDLSGTDIQLCDTTTTVTNQVTANVTAVSGDSAAADNLEADYDGTGYAKANSTIGTCTTNTDMRGTDNAFLAASAPTNFSDLSITASTGLVDITQAGADKAWNTTTRTLSAATNITSDGSAVTMSSSGVVGTVNLVNTTTTNTDMRGTDSAATASALTTVDTVVDAIKAKTDSLTFTSGTDLDCNVQKINDVTITGNGQAGTEFGV